jgi:hypothetical protein
MSTELDHLFLCTARGAPEAAQLIAFGLTEGSPNRHPGQGTANRRFFFDNAFLELVWVEDEVEAQSDLVRRTGLWERCTRRASGASPFGVGLRPAAGAAPACPFPAWLYRPPYLPAPLAIEMANNSDNAAGPLLFYLPFGRRPDPNDVSRRQPREHRAGLRSITRVRVGLAEQTTLSPEYRAASDQCPGLEFHASDAAILEIGFDGETAGQTADFRPGLPLVLHW